MSNVDSRCYLQRIREHPEEADKKAKHFRRIMAAVPAQKFNEVLEIFGGVGVIWEELVSLGYAYEETFHETWEQSSDCVNYLRDKFPDSDVRRVDSFEEDIPCVDFLSADFNSWTYLRYIQNDRGGRYHHLTNRLFRSSSRYIHITDSAINKFHLNKQVYAGALNCRLETIEDYYRAVSEDFDTRFGYRLIASSHHPGAGYLLFTNSR
jgi:hypothetical protein